MKIILEGDDLYYCIRCGSSIYYGPEAEYPFTCPVCGAQMVKPMEGGSYDQSIISEKG